MCKVLLIHSIMICFTLLTFIQSIKFAKTNFWKKFLLINLIFDHVHVGSQYFYKEILALNVAHRGFVRLY